MIFTFYGKSRVQLWETPKPVAFCFAVCGKRLLVSLNRDLVFKMCLCVQAERHFATATLPSTCEIVTLVSLCCSCDDTRRSQLAFCCVTVWLGAFAVAGGGVTQKSGW
jgi:hypothetical protein